MKLTKIAVVALLLVFAVAAWPQPPKTAKPAASPVYGQRVKVVSDEMKNQMADLWQIYGKLEDLNGVMEKHAARNGDATAADKDEWNKLKSSLNSVVQHIRGNAKRLRSISPIPRSLKKIDTELVDASFELEEGLDSLISWTNTPSPEMNLQLGRQLRKAVTSWSNALISLNRNTDPAVKAKVYTEN